MYGSCGLFGGKIRSLVTGRVLDLGDRDFRCNPDTGAIEPASGRTQQGRVRDDWGNWFGCDNSTLCLHYPLADHYLHRNPHAAPSETAVLVPDYPNRNHLFPIQPQLQLFKLSGPPGNTTAACGLGIYRDDLLGKGNAFVCEPVNLLVHRLVLSPKGSTFSGRRAADEISSEFLASKDNWSRFAQMRTGPDGCLWVVDMYRYVIEHPRWIPPEELAKLDIRAGDTMGRIYRIGPKDRPVRSIPHLCTLDDAGLVTALDTPNGWQRDLAGQMLLWTYVCQSKAPARATLTKLLEGQIKTSPRPETRLQGSLELLQTHVVREALADSHACVRHHAIRLAERFLSTSPELVESLPKLIDDTDSQVRLQVAYSLGQWRDPQTGHLLAALARRDADDPYLWRPR